MQNKTHKKGLGIILIIAIIAAIFGAGGVLLYIQSNQDTLEPMVETVREERAESAQSNGYPAIWAADNLPEYPNGELRKVREMGNVTLWTDDSPQEVLSFFENEMPSRGFTSISEVSNNLVVVKMYKKDSSNFTLQATVKKDTGKTEVVMLYKH